MRSKPLTHAPALTVEPTLAQLVAARRDQLRRGETPQVLDATRLTAWQSVTDDPDTYIKQWMHQKLTWCPCADFKLPRGWPALQAIELSIAELAATFAPTHGEAEIYIGDERLFLTSPFASEQALKEQVGAYLARQNKFSALLINLVPAQLFDLYAHSFDAAPNAPCTYVPRTTSTAGMQGLRIVVGAEGSPVSVGRFETAVRWSYNVTRAVAPDNDATEIVRKHLPVPEHVFVLLRQWRIDYFDFAPEDTARASLGALQEARCASDEVKYLLQPHLLPSLANCAYALLPLERALTLLALLPPDMALLCVDLLEHYVSHAEPTSATRDARRAAADWLEDPSSGAVFYHLLTTQAAEQGAPELSQRPWYGAFRARFALRTFLPQFPSLVALQLFLQEPWDADARQENAQIAARAAAALAVANVPGTPDVLTSVLIAWKRKDMQVARVGLVTLLQHRDMQTDSLLAWQLTHFLDRMHHEPSMQFDADLRFALAWLCSGKVIAKAIDYAIAVCRTEQDWAALRQPVRAALATLPARAGDKAKTVTAAVIHAQRLMQQGDEAATVLFLTDAVVRLGQKASGVELNQLGFFVQSLTRERPSLLTKKLFVAWLRHLPQPPNIVRFVQLNWQTGECDELREHLNRAVGKIDVQALFGGADPHDAVMAMAQTVVLTHQLQQARAAHALQRVFDHLSKTPPADAAAWVNATLLDSYARYITRLGSDKPQQRALAMQWAQVRPGTLDPVLAYLATVPVVEGALDFSADMEFARDAARQLTAAVALAYVNAQPRDPYSALLLGFLDACAEGDEVREVWRGWIALAASAPEGAKAWCETQAITSQHDYYTSHAAPDAALLLFNEVVGAAAETCDLCDSDRALFMATHWSTQYLRVGVVHRSTLLAQRVVQGAWVAAPDNAWRHKAQDHAHCVLANDAYDKQEYAKARDLALQVPSSEPIARAILGAAYVRLARTDNEAASMRLAAAAFAKYVADGYTHNKWLQAEEVFSTLAYAENDDAKTLVIWLAMVKNVGVREAEQFILAKRNAPAAR